MEYNYPIKYVIEPIHMYAKNNGYVLGYIVTKAFLVTEVYNYTNEGLKKQYYVVYPVKGLKSIDIMQNIRTPEFGSSNTCKNSEYVTEIFDTYEQAKKICNQKNGELFRNYYPNYDYTERMNFFQDFEYKVMEKTSELTITEDIKIKKI